MKRTRNPFALARYAWRTGLDSLRMRAYCKRNHIEIVYANSVNAFLYAIPASMAGIPVNRTP